MFILLSPLVYAEDFTINKYDIKMVVNENNTYNITETILVNFPDFKHGIYRTIPIDSGAKISDVDVNEEFTESEDNKNYVIKIGNPDKEIIGTKNYVINYTYNKGNDTSTDKDELYFNLIGTGWDTTISNITFKIVMPKKFDSSKLSFVSGPYGSTSSENISFKVDGNEINGSYNGILDKNNGLTIKLDLEDGYFTKQKDVSDIVGYTNTITIISSAIAVFLLIQVFGLALSI